MCPECGHPADEPLLTPLAADRGSSPAPPTAGPASDAAGLVAARIVGIFAVIGFGLGLATLLFLWATGFFTTSTVSADSLADVALGAFVFAVVAAFAVLIGVVVAAVGGVYAANHTDDRPTAIRVGAIGAAAGHFALIIVVIGFVLVSFALQSVMSSDPVSPAQITPSPQQIAECERALGVGAPVCRQLPQGLVTPRPDAVVDGGVDWPDVDDVARFGIGIIPAAIVGALSAAVVFARERSL